MLIPLNVAVPMQRWPYANWVLLGLLVAAFGLELGGSRATVMMYVLRDWSPLGIIGYMFLHAGVLHLVGNLIFLWAFGNAVCAKFNNLAFIPLFLLWGVCAAVVHLLFDGKPAVGASGAINGVVGAYLILYPLNDISCLFFLFGVRVITISGYWLILFWLAFDIWGAVAGREGIAFMAHLGGFASGVAVTLLALKYGFITMDRAELSLVQVLVKMGLIRRRPAPVPPLDAAGPAAAAPDPGPPAPPVHAARPATIVVQCLCGATIRAPAVHAGRNGRCPRCRATFKIPAA